MTLILLPAYAEVAFSNPWKMVVVYTIAPNFFWMFVEGLHLYLRVFHPLWLKSFKWMKLMMVSIGWVIPAVLTTVWILQQHITKDDFQFLALPELICILGPIYLVLLMNLVIMIRIIYALATKVDSTLYMYKLQDTDNYSMHMIKVKKLAKFSIVFIVLLGIPQLIPILVSNMVTNHSVNVVVHFLNSIWSAFQGFFVAVFYVLTNKKLMSHTKRHFSNMTSVTPPQTYVWNMCVGQKRFCFIWYKSYVLLLFYCVFGLYFSFLFFFFFFFFFNFHLFCHLRPSLYNIYMFFPFKNIAKYCTNYIKIYTITGLTYS